MKVWACPECIEEINQGKPVWTGANRFRARFSTEEQRRLLPDREPL